ncbi:MAG: hypothetical protein LKJ86_10405, partial [Oscillibacter sp.]|nr:hypothetical protein [Oscillibacter sp.]
MKHRIKIGRMHRALSRLAATAFVAALTVTLVPVNANAEEISNGVTPTCDEAYYAMLDYYGNLKESSVVKSYSMNGVSKLTDYGQYDKINNLTNDAKPTVSGNTTTFDFGKNVPDHFYFEGKTTQPFKELPWS